MPRGAARVLGGLCFCGAARVLGGLCFCGAARVLDGLCFCGAARVLGGLCFCAEVVPTLLCFRKLISPARPSYLKAGSRSLIGAIWIQLIPMLGRCTSS